MGPAAEEERGVAEIAARYVRGRTEAVVARLAPPAAPREGPAAPRRRPAGQQPQAGGHTLREEFIARLHARAFLSGAVLAASLRTQPRRDSAEPEWIVKVHTVPANFRQRSGDDDDDDGQAPPAAIEMPRRTATEEPLVLPVPVADSAQSSGADSPEGTPRSRRRKRGKPLAPSLYMSSPPRLSAASGLSPTFGRKSKDVGRVIPKASTPSGSPAAKSSMPKANGSGRPGPARQGNSGAGTGRKRGAGFQRSVSSGGSPLSSGRGGGSPLSMGRGALAGSRGPGAPMSTTLGNLRDHIRDLSAASSRSSSLRSRDPERDDLRRQSSAGSDGRAASRGSAFRISRSATPQQDEDARAAGDGCGPEEAATLDGGEVGTCEAIAEDGDSCDAGAVGEDGETNGSCADEQGDEYGEWPEEVQEPIAYSGYTLHPDGLEGDTYYYQWGGPDGYCQEDQYAAFLGPVELGFAPDQCYGGIAEQCPVGYGGIFGQVEPAEAFDQGQAGYLSMTGQLEAVGGYAGAVGHGTCTTDVTMDPAAAAAIFEAAGLMLPPMFDDGAAEGWCYDYSASGSVDCEEEPFRTLTAPGQASTVLSSPPSASAEVGEESQDRSSRLARGVPAQGGKAGKGARARTGRSQGRRGPKLAGDLVVLTTRGGRSSCTSPGVAAEGGGEEDGGWRRPQRRSTQGRGLHESDGGNSHHSIHSHPSMNGEAAEGEGEQSSGPSPAPSRSSPTWGGAAAAAAGAGDAGASKRQLRSVSLMSAEQKSAKRRGQRLPMVAEARAHTGRASPAASRRRGARPSSVAGVVHVPRSPELSAPPTLAPLCKPRPEARPRWEGGSNVLQRRIPRYDALIDDYCPLMTSPMRLQHIMHTRGLSDEYGHIIRARFEQHRQLFDGVGRYGARARPEPPPGSRPATSMGFAAAGRGSPVPGGFASRLADLAEEESLDWSPGGQGRESASDAPGDGGGAAAAALRAGASAPLVCCPEWRDSPLHRAQLTVWEQGGGEDEEGAIAAAAEAFVAMAEHPSGHTAATGDYAERPDGHAAGQGAAWGDGLQARWAGLKERIEALWFRMSIPGTVCHAIFSGPMSVISPHALHQLEKHLRDLEAYDTATTRLIRLVLGRQELVDRVKGTHVLGVNDTRLEGLRGDLSKLNKLSTEMVRSVGAWAQRFRHLIVDPLRLPAGLTLSRPLRPVFVWGGRDLVERIHSDSDFLARGDIANLGRAAVVRADVGQAVVCDGPDEDGRAETPALVSAYVAAQRQSVAEVLHEGPPPQWYSPEVARAGVQALRRAAVAK